MKTLVFTLVLLCATATFAQVGTVLSGETNKIEIPSHPAHASQQSLAQEQNILGNTTPTIVRGVRPMWEVFSAKDEVSLGEAARLQRRVHANDKKAPVVWLN
jgi:hypothetical protein